MPKITEEKGLKPSNTLRSGYSLDSYPVRLAGSNPSVRSEENKSYSDFETPEEVEQIYNEIFKDVPQDTLNNLTSLSQKSKHSNPQNSSREVFKDWALTPLYDEYERVGNSLLNSKFDANNAHRGGVMHAK